MNAAHIGNLGDDLMAALIVNHRRNRREVRRILAAVRVHYRDLTRSPFQEIDTVNDHRHRVFVYPGVTPNGGRY